MSLTSYIDASLKHPFSMTIAGNRRAGKSEFTKRLLFSKEKLISPNIEHIVWIYASWQKELFESLSSRLETIEFIEGLPQNNIEMEFISERNVKNLLIVIDDMMSEASERVDIKNLFTRGRHLNTSVIFLTQNLFHKGKHTRDMSLNSDYIVLFKNPRDASIIGNLAKQMMPGNTKFLQWAYREATKEPFSYLFIDLRSDTDERVRYQSDILSDFPVIYLPNFVKS